MTEIRLENVTKRFEDVTALNNVSLTIQDGEFFVLLGPTGAGKTTMLRVIAGLEQQDEGAVIFDGQPMNGVSPAERDVAFVFQQYSLYPNMTVYENLAFPLKSPMRGKDRNDKAKIDEAIRHTADILNIPHLLDRKTARLSGGEMQRVSIGRAIVRNPNVYLMDEPLSNLDAKLRERLRVEIQHIQKTQANTTLFVTYDQVEALTMADRLAVLDEGHLLQVGTPHDIYDHPQTAYVARLVGTPPINLLAAQRSDDVLSIHDSSLTLPAPKTAELPEALQVGIRPEDVTIRGDGAYEGQVRLTEPLGVETILHIQVGEQTLLAVVAGSTNIQLNDTIRFDVLTERVHYFDTAGQRISVAQGETLTKQTI